MKREADLTRQLRSLQALGQAVSAMKSLSAHHFRETRSVVEPARVYREGIERMLGCAGAVLAAGSGAAGVLVIGAELGLCGSYNSRVVALGAQRRAELGEGPTLCVGRRAAALLGRRGVPVRQVYAGPTSVRGITELLLRLAEDVLQAYATENLSSFELVSSRFAGVGNDEPRSHRLLPLQPQLTGPAPRVRYVRPASFASVVIREYLYIQLYDLILDALAAEHGARLLATQAAEKWLQDRSERLGRELAATRREASTREMIEIASGARARVRPTPVSASPVHASSSHWRQKGASAVER